MSGLDDGWEDAGSDTTLGDTEIFRVNNSLDDTDTISGDPLTVNISLHSDSLQMSDTASLPPPSPPAYLQVMNHDHDVSYDHVFFENTNNISFLHWNVDGIISKLKDPDFVSYVSKFDVICLVETFVKKFENTLFPLHTMFIKPSDDLGNKGRDSGGCICLIRSTLMKYFTHMKYDGCGNFLSFIIDKHLFGFHSDVLFLSVYIPPECSVYYKTHDIDNGVQYLEDYLIDCFRELGEIPVLICGDLNGRTSDIMPDIYDVDKIFDHLHDETFLHKRCSEDKVTNTYGKSLLDMCSSLNLFILNGACNGDLQGHFTYIYEFGSSINDYFIMSYDLFDDICNRCSLFVAERIDSKHMPLEFRLCFSECKNGQYSEDCLGILEKYSWDSDCEMQFKDKVFSNVFKDKITEALTKLGESVNDSIILFNNAIKSCADNMKKNIRFSSKQKNDDWFDYECILFRRIVRKNLRKYRKSLNEIDRHEYCKSRREYKNLILSKKRTYKNSLFDKLIAAVSNQNDFWRNVKNILKRKCSPKHTITLEQWFNHFKSVLENSDINNDNPQNNFDGEMINDLENIDDLDKPISKDEILTAIRKLKNGKAAGPDGLIGEFYKFAATEIIDYLHELFNKLFDNGFYPNDWSESIILPLFKKGNVNDPNNYRGISLCNIASKLYSSVINNRIKFWIEINNITGEFQAGFKSKYSTIDHIFTLLACVQKQFSNTRNRKLYVAFIDFQKAFDSINRKLLWPILIKNKIHGKLLKCIKSMYSDVKARIRSGAKLTEIINCTEGVKQGDVCSPLLFSLFINELALEIIQKGRHGIHLSPDVLELFIMLFADDIILMSETVVGLQVQLNNLYTSAQKLQLTVNLAKSNIIVFRLGGFLGVKEKWFYGGKRMEVVNIYKYLGIIFSTKLSFSFACQDLVARAKRATSCILCTLYKFEKVSVQVFMKLFDSKVQPILQYGAEVWGLMAGELIEPAHLFAMKRFLCVDRRTPNDLVYGEYARYPVYINSYVRCIRYWLKLVTMSSERLPYKAYIMLRMLDERGKKTWVTYVRECLSKYGFACVWLSQGVGDVNVFMKCFKERLIDCRWQEWSDHINTSERYSFYCQLKPSFSSTVEPYLTLNMNRYIMKALIFFRLGISDLLVHRNRYKISQNNLCRFCSSDIENELHVVLCCPELADLRNDFIPFKYHNHPSMFRLILLLSCKKEDVIHGLALYLYKCFQYLDHMNS